MSKWDVVWPALSATLPLPLIDRLAECAELIGEHDDAAEARAIAAKARADPMVVRRARAVRGSFVEWTDAELDAMWETKTGVFAPHAEG